MGNYLRLWDTFFELEKVQYRALYVSSEKRFGRYCNQYIRITVPTSEKWLRIADEFNEICKMSRNSLHFMETVS
jgi:histidinol-phosphate/aromatic aminotransferase/cobyric acid decarboxylase-like protein